MTTTYLDLAAAYDGARARHLQRLGEAQAVQDEVTRLRTAVATEDQMAMADAQVAALFQSYTEAEHDQLRRRVESLVTQGIAAVFGPIYEFRMTTTSERGQAAVRFTLASELGTVEHPVMDAQGGGLASVIGFILRVVVLVLDPTQGRRLLVLDETFGMVSAEYHARLAQFLRQLVDDLDLQLVLITHAPAQGAYADVVYRVGLEGDETKAVRIGTEEL